MDKFPTPKDADQSLIVPRIVDEVYNKLKKEGKTVDSENKKTHLVFIKMMTAVAKAAAIAHKKFVNVPDPEVNDPELVEILFCRADAFELGAYVNVNEFARKSRKDLFRFFEQPYKSILTDMRSFPPTPTDLLGEDMEKMMKSCDMTNKLMTRAMGRQTIGKKGNNNNNTNKGRGNQNKPKQGGFYDRRDDHRDGWQNNKGKNSNQRSKTPNKNQGQKQDNKSDNRPKNNNNKY